MQETENILSFRNFKRLILEHRPHKSPQEIETDKELAKFILLFIQTLIDEVPILSMRKPELKTVHEQVTVLQNLLRETNLDALMIKKYFSTAVIILDETVSAEKWLVEPKSERKREIYRRSLLNEIMGYLFQQRHKYQVREQLMSDFPELKTFYAQSYLQLHAYAQKRLDAVLQLL